jgi:hypothetical protein
MSEKLKEFVKANPGIHRFQGVPAGILARKALIVLAARAGTDIHELAGEYDEAFNKIRLATIRREEERLVTRRKREADWTKSAQAWMEEHVMITGHTFICDRPDPRSPADKSCGGTIDPYRGLIDNLRPRVKESEFGEESKSALMKYLTNLQATGGRCRKCGRGISISRGNINVTIK